MTALARRHAMPLAVGIALVVAAALIVLAIMHAVASRLFGSDAPPYHPHNASWRYGNSTLYLQAYQHSTDIAASCRAAAERAQHVPKGFEIDEAVAGCRYADWSARD